MMLAMRTGAPAEFTATLELCRFRVARHAAAFEMAAEYFCAGGEASDVLQNDRDWRSGQRRVDSE